MSVQELATVVYPSKASSVYAASPHLALLRLPPSYPCILLGAKGVGFTAFSGDPLARAAWGISLVLLAPPVGQAPFAGLTTTRWCGTAEPFTDNWQRAELGKKDGYLGDP